MVNPESMAIERFMRRCGVTKNLSAGQSNDPLDHIGTVCEFLEYLCLVAAKAIQPNEGTILYANDFAEFLDEFFSEYATWCASEILKTQPSKPSIPL